MIGQGTRTTQQSSEFLKRDLAIIYIGYPVSE